MKTLDIARKDLIRSSRSFSVWIFGLAVPLLTSGIFFFAFGGLGNGGFDLPVTRVVVANLDSPVNGFSAGQLLLDFLKAEDFREILAVSEVADAATARRVVDQQQAGVAVILPADLTTALVRPGERAVVELYQDPTLTLGPGIVSGIIGQFVDGLIGSSVAANVVTAQLAEYGHTMDAATSQAIAVEYGRWAAAMGASQQQGAGALLDIHRPAVETRSEDVRSRIVSLIMAGMMVFFVFFTGAASAESLLAEEEAGTLARLFTTPTPISTILGGRMLATLVTLILQVVMLVTASALLFRVHWGSPAPALGVAAGMILLSAGFGLFLTSLLKDRRQGGLVYGGVLTVMGNLGMINIFTAQVAGPARQIFDTLSLLVPQGWAVRGWQLLQAGDGTGDVLVTVLVMVSLAGIFFAAGLLRFRKRFA